MKSGCICLYCLFPDGELGLVYSLGMGENFDSFRISYPLIF